MSRAIYKRYIKDFKANLLDCKFLGRGNNGIVYRLPEGKVIKVCFEEKKCRKEYYILNRIHKNKYFPRVYGMSGNYMIRDYVEGIPLNRYIRNHGLDRELAIKILKLLKEFKKLKFAKEDIRCKDIMVHPKGTLMVIDPKKCFSKERDFPRHLSKGLYRLGVLDKFMEVVKERDPKSYRRWHDKIYTYIEELKLESN
ncbi:MAG TPA: protein kinase [Clostridium sp.]|jgi:RIO-like serine/threonine protein kinase|nr:protein kinase [Clostridia bacterium]HCW05676.1 protein kinase [Clostridium sp.]